MQRIVIDVATGALQASDRPCCSVHHRLQMTELIRRGADQRDVAVVKPAQYQCDDKRLVDGRRTDRLMLRNCLSVAKQLATVRWKWMRMLK